MTDCGIIEHYYLYFTSNNFLKFMLNCSSLGFKIITIMPEYKDVH